MRIVLPDSSLPYHAVRILAEVVPQTISAWDLFLIGSSHGADLEWEVTVSATAARSFAEYFMRQS